MKKHENVMNCLLVVMVVLGLMISVEKHIAYVTLFISTTIAYLVINILQVKHTRQEKIKQAYIELRNKSIENFIFRLKQYDYDEETFKIKFQEMISKINENKIIFLNIGIGIYEHKKIYQFLVKKFNHINEQKHKHYDFDDKKKDTNSSQSFDSPNEIAIKFLFQCESLYSHMFLKENIKKQYRKMAKVYHPDRGGTDAKFQELNEMYQIALNG